MPRIVGVDTRSVEVVVEKSEREMVVAPESNIKGSVRAEEPALPGDEIIRARTVAPAQELERDRFLGEIDGRATIHLAVALERQAVGEGRMRIGARDVPVADIGSVLEIAGS